MLDVFANRMTAGRSCLARLIPVLWLVFTTVPAHAQYEVGVQALERGDYAEAWIMLAPLARAGDARAQHDVGLMHALGLGVEASMETAAVWVERAAKQGNATSQARLGWMYFHGAGVPRDLERAAYWSRLGAEGGDAWAQSNFGYALFTGQGVARDRIAAVTWYRRAAEQGLPEGQRNLGEMYEIGNGVPADDVTAYAWYGVAAVGGDVAAIALRDRLEARLEPQELDRAREMARALLGAHGSRPELGR